MLQNQICFYIWTVQANGKFITIAEIDDIAFGKQILLFIFNDANFLYMQRMF